MSPWQNLHRELLKCLCCRLCPHCARLRELTVQHYWFQFYPCHSVGLIWQMLSLSNPACGTGSGRLAISTKTGRSFAATATFNLFFCGFTSQTIAFPVFPSFSIKAVSPLLKVEDELGPTMESCRTSTGGGWLERHCVEVQYVCSETQLDSWYCVVISRRWQSSH